LQKLHPRHQVPVTRLPPLSVTIGTYPSALHNNIGPPFCPVVLSTWPWIHRLRNRLKVDDDSARLVNVGLTMVAKQLGGPLYDTDAGFDFQSDRRRHRIKSASIVKLDGSLRHVVLISSVLRRKGFTQHFEIEDSDLPKHIWATRPADGLMQSSR